MKIAVILAGGEGRRAGGPVPKQMADLCGRPVLWWSMKAFLDEDPSTSIILTMHPGLFDDWDVLLDSLPASDRLPHILCCGGRTRTESVQNSLISVRDLVRESGADPAACKVAIHDAARPLVSRRVIAEGWRLCASGVCSVPAVAPVSSLRELLDDGSSRPVDRSRYREVQTPQTLTLPDMETAYAMPLPDTAFTDDASLAQARGVSVHLFEGDPANIKITLPQDFAIASLLMKK